MPYVSIARNFQGQVQSGVFAVESRTHRSWPVSYKSQGLYTVEKAVPGT